MNFPRYITADFSGIAEQFTYEFHIVLGKLIAVKIYSERAVVFQMCIIRILDGFPEQHLSLRKPGTRDGSGNSLCRCASCAGFVNALKKFCFHSYSSSPKFSSTSRGMDIYWNKSLSSIWGNTKVTPIRFRSASRFVCILPENFGTLSLFIG